MASGNLRRVVFCIAGLLITTGLVCGFAQPAIAHAEIEAPFLDIAQQTLSPQLMALGVGLALIFGAGHALAPGHGKTMVAAYLVGSQGTARHAILLGLITTLTHMLGVYILGFVTFLASAYVLPETLYPVLEAVSGLTICFVGASLLYRRMMHSGSHAHGHHHDHHHEHAHRDDHPHSHPDLTCHHDHDHPLLEKITLKSLVSLGIAGGIVPCPSALFLLLSAISLHQAIYGMVLISAFSIGLAGIMVGLGLVAVYARQWLEKIPSLDALQRYLPIASSIVMIAVGFALSANVVWSSVV
jgi:nickel/cobalt transporter (NicO) family protein